MEHTKGEWVIDKNNTMVAILKDGVYKYIADCDPHHFCNSELEDEECEANAKLIAAAPELLENLTRIIDRIEEQELRNNFPSAYKRAKDAINKAKGK